MCGGKIVDNSKKMETRYRSSNQYNHFEACAVVHLLPYPCLWRIDTRFI